MSTTLLLWVIFAITAGGITNAKRRGWKQGLIWGGLLGIAGVIVVMFLPVASEAEAAAREANRKPGFFTEYAD